MRPRMPSSSVSTGSPSEQLGIPDNPDKWPGRSNARLTETLAAGKGARSYPLTFISIELGVARDDAAFAEAMKKARNVVLTERYPDARTSCWPDGGDLPNLRATTSSR